MSGYYIIHYGVSAEDGPPGRGSGRYPLGSGDRPYQNKEELRAIRREKFKATAKKVAAGAGKAAWTGVTVALKVVASSAITSATIAGLATAGFQFLQSPAAQQIMNRIGVAAGNFLYANFVAPAANQAARNIDSAIGVAMNAVGAIDPGSPSAQAVIAGTKYIPQILASPTGQAIIGELTKGR